MGKPFTNHDPHGHVFVIGTDHGPVTPFQVPEGWPSDPENAKIVRTILGEIALELRLITPELASEWLAKKAVSRPCSSMLVQRLAGAIERGEWRPDTGETIKFNRRGELIDGQHRLSAVVASDRQIVALVATGIDDSALDVIDTGRPRNVGDVLALHGYRSTHTLAAAARLLIAWDEAHRPGTTWQQLETCLRLYRASAAQTLSYIAGHLDVFQGVSLAERFTHGHGVPGGRGLWGALFALFVRLDEVAAVAFATNIGIGANLPPHDPALVLRERLFRARSTRERLSPVEIAALIVKAWNVYRRGEERRARGLHWRVGWEAFPEPV